MQKLLAVAMTDETGVNIQYLDTPKIMQRLLSPALVKFLAGLALPDVFRFDGKRIDADGNRIRRDGEVYRANGTKVMFDGMENRSTGV